MLDMNALQALLRPNRTLVLPGVYDALSARMAELAGFQAFSIGGNAVGVTQLALPDLGMQSLGEFRDSVARARAGSNLPCLVDGEDGFGDVRMVTRTVRTLEQMGVDAMFFEDLVPPRAGEPIAIVDLRDMTAKLQTALQARRNDTTWIVGRTDAAHAGLHDDVVARALAFASVGVDAVLAFGLRSLEDMQRLRDAVTLPLIAVVVEGKPWVVPSLDELNRIGIDIAVYPVALVQRVAAALHLALHELPRQHDEGRRDAAPAFDLAVVLRTADWQAMGRKEQR